MESLPKDVTMEMALNLSPPALINFCTSSKKSNQVCNSDSFWRRKLEKDYPKEFYKTEKPIVNPKQIYIYMFTFISRQIEEFMKIFLSKIFAPFSYNFLTSEYKKELSSKIYEIYQQSEDYENKDENEDEDEDEYYEFVVTILNPYIPDRFWRRGDIYIWRSREIC